MDEEEEVSDEEILDALDTFLIEAGNAQESVLNGLRQQQQKRANRLEATSRRLTGALGGEHPRVAHLQQAAGFSSEMGRQLGVVAKRHARRPQLKSYEWMVFGRVLDPSGKPLAGQAIQVHDEDRRYHDLLGTAVTDEFGDFAVTYHERAFQEHGEKQPELFVTLVDKSGDELMTTRESARFRGGRFEYFEIVYDRDG